MQTHLKGLLAALPREPVSLHVRALSPLDVGTLAAVPVTVSVRDEATRTEVVQRQVLVHRDSTPVELGLLPAGSYLVQVAAEHGTARVSDVFVVASPQETVGL